MSFTIGIDVGGTKVLGGVVDQDGSIIASARRDTPERGGVELTDAIAEVAQELLQQYPVERVGISTAGFISADRKTIYANPNIKNWDGVQLQDELSRRVKAEFVVENDANCAAWAEYVFGAGRGCDVMVMLTIGTGVGGGIVIDGKIHRGHFGIGGEMGHMRVVPDGELCGCGVRGCFEVYASGSALVRYGERAIERHPERAQALLRQMNGAPLQGAHITTAAQAGDELAIELFAQLGSYIGEGIASINAILDPGIVVIGGGVVEAGDLLLAPIREAFHRAMPSADMRPLATILPAQLSNNAGVVGAADLARR